MLWLYITLCYVAFAAGFVVAVLLIKTTDREESRKQDEFLSCFMRDLRNNRYIRS